MMAHIMLLLLPCVMSARTRLIPPGYETVSTRDANKDSHKVLTVKGKECKFPFRQGGSIHHHCINKTSSRSWCSLTHNFDRDLLWDYCVPPTAQPTEFLHASRRFTDPCRFNPCQNGGVCTLVPHRLSFECSCPDNFTGSLCELRKCYETVHLRYYDIGESWGRVHLRNVEQCKCVAGQIFCKRAHYTVCRENPCMNEGSCRRISTTGEEVCACRPGHSGAKCDIAPAAECYRNKGAEYRGVAATTVTGARCLPWNSKLLHDELCVDTVDSAPLRGLGEHSYCRNPDGDKMPWCYTLNDGAISWEHCDVPSCAIRWEFDLLVKAKKMRRAPPLSRRIISLSLEKTNFTTPAKKPVCGKKHKKRISRGRIMGGTTTLPGTHPWMAAMYIGDDSFCAGTLVSSCWVVSAAHCFFRSPLVSKIRVVLGQQNFNVTNPNTRTFGVEKYIFPKQFSVFNPTLHDIVLVKLKKENGRCVRRTQFIRPICLPDKDMKFPDCYPCQITGWGHMNEKANKYSNLQEAVVKIISHEICTQPDVYGNHVTSNMICAGTNVCVDACQGDSGGPLACVKDDVSFLYGIISWGDGCGRTNKPGVYTKVGNYVPWINQIISRKPKSRMNSRMNT